MNLKQGIQMRWAVLVIIAFVAIWLVAYYGWGRWNAPPVSATQPDEVPLGLVCVNPRCGRQTVMTITEFNALPTVDGAVKCPVCGEPTLTVDRHYRPPEPIEPTP